MNQTAKGTFTVTIQPAAEPDVRDGLSLGRMTLDKVFAGDLVGTGKGQMLTAMTPVKGSAGYVAIERFSGTVHGKAGSFALQHSGVMSAAGQSLSIRVVPDSGSGELTGIAGELAIRIDGGQHFYEFTYTLPR